MFPFKCKQIKCVPATRDWAFNHRHFPYCYAHYGKANISHLCLERLAPQISSGKPGRGLRGGLGLPRAKTEL